MSSNFIGLPYQGGTEQQVAFVVNNILNGKINSTGTVTLTASTTTTTVSDNRVGENSVILFMPTTANASAEQGAGTMFVGTRAKQSFTITHTNNAQNDRTFAYSVIG